jgi:hypothetical protein
MSEKIKIKPLIDKIKNFNAIGMPCSGVEFGKLKDGKTIAVPEKVAKELTSLGIVKVETKKKKKGDK